jgi:glucose/arabinose dehydrogenase
VASRRWRSLLTLAAKVAGAVAVVVTIVIWNPFGKSTGPSSAANIRPFASGFDQPTAIASTPAEPRRLYVVEQAGRIRYLVGNRIAGTFLDIRSRVLSGGERGLLSVAFSPRYARDHRFYVDYTDRNGDTRVVEFRSRRGKAVTSTARQLLFVKQPYANHNGGQLQFGPDGLLYVGMGDGGSAGDPGNRAQTLSIHLGKLLRINPFKRGARWQAVGYGLRNPWRFSFDRETGDLYIADVGQSAWEEIDFRPKAAIGSLANYGWHVYEGRQRYARGTPNARGQLVFPVAVYSHDDGCSVTGGYVYRGHAVQSAMGRYFYGDWCSGTIWSLRIENGNAVDVRTEGARIGALTSFGEDAAGELYAASGGSGRIYRVVP